MFPSVIRLRPVAAATSHSLKELLPTYKPPQLRQPGNLYKVLSRTEAGGVGKEVHQTRWSRKNIHDCYWLVTRTKFKMEGAHGKAWGLLHWKGQCVSSREERIRGGLKYAWNEGRS